MSFAQYAFGMSDPRADGDDDALSWGGDDDPTLSPSGVAPRERMRPKREAQAATHSDAQTSAERRSDAAGESPVVLPEGFAAVGKGSETISTEHEMPPMSNAMLITVGILVGIYALITIGWLVGGLRLQSVAVVLVDPIAYAIGMWLGILAPALWFLATWVLTARSRTWVRLTWLIAGVVLLVPWPFVMVGAVGS